MQYEIIFKNINDYHQSRWLICKKILANESFKSAKLKRHLHTKHVSLAYFIFLKDCYKISKNKN